MPLDTTSASGLVAGSPANGRGPTPPVFHGRLLRAVCIGGQRVEAGTVVTGDRGFIAMLVGANKAERCEAPAPAPAAPAPAAPAADATQPETTRGRRANKGTP